MTMQGGRPPYAILATALTLQGLSDGHGQATTVVTLQRWNKTTHNNACRSATVQRRGVKTAPKVEA
jgi:hypothetical protein